MLVNPVSFVAAAGWSSGTQSRGQNCKGGREKLTGKGIGQKISPRKEFNGKEVGQNVRTEIWPEGYPVVTEKLTKKTDGAKAILVRAEELSQWLGPKRFYNEIAERITSPGVVVGLAWTAHGGDILFIEATDLPGSGQLKFTGQMGEVMTESAQIAWTYVKKKAVRELKIDPKYFKENDLHLHIPAGAIPKDGPSAGITMASALYSLLFR